MEERAFIDEVGRGEHGSDRVEILLLRAHSIDENVRRLTRFLKVVGEACDHNYDRSDWIRHEDRIVARLPHGGRAEILHASGAMRLVSGLQPMERLFPSMKSRDALEKLVRSVAGRLRIDDWVAAHETLEFERLWQIKAAAANRERIQARPVLCRAVGAFRQSVRGLPILGGASVVLKVAAEGALDALSTQLVETASEAFESAPLLPPKEAARAIYRQLQSLMGGKAPLSRSRVTAEPLRLGYLHLGRRKTQRLLAPHYFAAVRVEGQEVLAYHLVTPATELVYQPLCLAGHDAPAARLRRAA